MGRHYYLPRPYPDELIGSVLVRAGRHRGLSIKQMHQQFGLPQKSEWALLFLSQIEPVASAFGIPAEQLLIDHTPFQYVTAFDSTEQTRRLTSYYCGSSLLASSALSQSATTGGTWARFCDECIKDDLLEFGEDYWHRRHNLPFVTRCWKHGSRLKTTPPIRAGLTIKSLPHELNGMPVAPVFDDDVHAQVESISIPLLEAQFRRSSQEWQRHYRHIAMQRGFPHQGNLLSSMAITKGFVTYFGEAQLERAGLAVPDKPNSWPVMLLRCAETSNVTAKHVLMQVYLQYAPVPPEVQHAPPGPQALNPQAMDRVFASAIRRQVAKMFSGTRITVTQLLAQLEILQPVRHHRKALPQTQAAIEEFRRSEFSARQIGRRPRTYLWVKKSA